MPAAAPYRHSVSKGPPSPPQPSDKSQPKQRLPPIADLLNGGLPPHDGLSDGKYRRDERDSYSYSPQQIRQGRPSVDERRGGRDSHDHYSLPMHSRPPPPGRISSGYNWSDRSSSSRSRDVYSQSIPPPPPARNGQPYSYPPTASRSPYSRYDREPSSSLPPPPPSYHHSPNSYPPPYPSSSQHNPSTYPPPRPSSNGYLTPSYDYPSSGHPSPYSDHSPVAGYPPDNRSIPIYDSMEERPTRKRRGNLPKWATDYLKQWFFEHVAHPYPTEQEKQELCKITGLGMTQLSNWFINARRRQNPVLHAQAQAETMIKEHSAHARNGSDSRASDHRRTEDD